jgi:hypothetical protein
MAMPVPEMASILLTLFEEPSCEVVNLLRDGSDGCSAWALQRLKAVPAFHVPLSISLGASEIASVF